MHIYLAARYSRYPELQQYAKALRDRGHVITGRWILGDHEMRADGQAETENWHHVWAEEDMADLLAADACISFTEGPGDALGRSRGGRHVELGMALATHKRCITVGYRENIFHWLAAVEFYATWEDCLQALGRD